VAVVGYYERDSHFHPQNSMAIATCEFFLFSGMKLRLKLRRFDSIVLIQSKSQEVMKTLRRNLF